jgi:hypothetical protein
MKEGVAQRMNRRHFVISLAAASFVRRPAFGQQPRITLALSESPNSPVIPRDFTGLSYESAQLANPAFFSAVNKPLIKLFRELSPSGNLRLGGGSSNFTTFSSADPTGPPPFEVFGPDTSHTVKSGTTTTTLALRNLRDFLDATGWSCLYGLNLGQGTQQNAVAEAMAAHRILGPRLLALQIGNEPDSFRNRYRPASYTPADYMREWTTFHDAILAAVPQARFAGPDISNKLAYLTAFAAEAPRHPDVILLTGHYYAMGPARSPSATLDQLFAPDPRLATIHAHELPQIAAAMQTAHLPFRITEGNSCWDGGKPGVSDTVASALWCAETMLRFAQFGWSGFNLHGGGNGFYTPIAGAPSTGFTRRPEYFGIQFAQRLSGARFLGCSLSGAPPHLLAYALEQHGHRRLALINANMHNANMPNADTQPLSILLPSRPQPMAEILTGPSLDSKDGTTLTTIKIQRSPNLTLPPHSAMLVTL